MLAKQSLLSADQSHTHSAWCSLSLHGAGSCGVIGVMYTEPTWHSNEIIIDCTHSWIKYLFS